LRVVAALAAPVIDRAAALETRASRCPAPPTRVHRIAAESRRAGTRD
jgi:hypothetical protein